MQQLLFLFLLRIVNSPFGRVLQAIRENEFRAEALGYNTVLYRIWANVLAAIVAEQQPAGPTTVYVILRAGTAEYLAADCTPSSPKWTRNTNLFRRFPSEAAADTFRRAIPGRKGGAEALTVECQETPAPAGGCEFCPAGGGGCAVCRSLTA